MITQLNMRVASINGNEVVRITEYYLKVTSHLSKACCRCFNAYCKGNKYKIGLSRI